MQAHIGGSVCWRGLRGTQTGIVLPAHYHKSSLLCTYTLCPGLVQTACTWGRGGAHRRWPFITACKMARKLPSGIICAFVPR